jgi:glycosyltransferase involved in cell wall biosynthesis
MKHLMWTRRVNPLVIPNGIPAERIREVPAESIKALRAAIGTEEILFKIGRWSPDKRWNMAVEALAEERLRGRDISMVIRGGIEPHALEVLHNAHVRGLKIVDMVLPEKTSEAIQAFNEVQSADIYNVIVHDGRPRLPPLLASDAFSPTQATNRSAVGLESHAGRGIAFVGRRAWTTRAVVERGVLDSDDPTRSE